MTYRLRKLFPGLLLAAALVAPAAPRLIAQEQTPAASSASGRASTPEAQPAVKENEESEHEAFRHSDSVKWIGSKLGLDPEQAATAFTWFNFAVLAILIVWFLLKKLPKTFRDRNSAIQKHFVEARSVTEEANARLSSVEARLSKLDEQIAAMRTQAEKDLAHDEERIKASIEEEKQRIVVAAEQEITAATALAHRQLKQYAADLAIEQAARKLAISAETDRLLVQDFVRRLAGEKDGRH